jgi:hypothetical protein
MPNERLANLSKFGHLVDATKREVVTANHLKKLAESH